jgi:hypothetical protein
MRLKIRCDGWKRKYFGFALEVNMALCWSPPLVWYFCCLRLRPGQGQTPPCPLRASLRWVLPLPFVLSHGSWLPWPAQVPALWWQRPPTVPVPHACCASPPNPFHPPPPGFSSPCPPPCSCSCQCRRPMCPSDTSSSSAWTGWCCWCVPAASSGGLATGHRAARLGMTMKEAANLWQVATSSTKTRQKCSIGLVYLYCFLYG